MKTNLKLISGGKKEKKSRLDKRYMNIVAKIGKLLQRLKNPRLLMTGELKHGTRVEKNLSLLFAATSIISIIIGFCILVLLLSLTGCDESLKNLQDEISKHEIGNLKSQDKNNPEILPYYEKFKVEARQRGIRAEDMPHIDFYFVSRIQPKCDPIGNNCIAGMAVVKKNGERFVSLDRMYWKRFKSDRRELLVFHELFHAIFRQKHDTACTIELKNGYCEQPASIMYPILPNDTLFYLKNRKVILDYDFSKAIDDY